MKLHRKSLNIGVIYALAGAVIRVNKADFALFNAVRHNRITVVLACNIGASAVYFLYGLVYAAVTVFKLFGASAQSKA